MILIAFGAAPNSGRAQGTGQGGALLTAEVSRSSPQVRSGAPITVVWAIKSQLTTVQEGHLEVVVQDGNEILARVRSDETAFGMGEQLVRMVLPSLDTHNPYGAVDMHLRLVGPKQTFDFGVFPLRVSTPWQRIFIVGVCDSWDAAPSPAKQTFVDRFRFETYNPEREDQTITTNVANLVPDTISPDPLTLCGLDVVVLVGRGFSDLKAPQLDALTAWVNAGGSCCIVPDGQPMKLHHLDFIKALCCLASDAPLQLDVKGHLVVAAHERQAAPHDSAEASSIRRKRFGLGRAALLLSSIDEAEAGDRSTVRSMLGFLWKLRQDQVSTFVETGKWHPDAGLATQRMAAQAEMNQPQVVQDVNGQPMVVADPYRMIRPRGMSLAPMPLQTGDQLLARLMPRDLKIVPLKLIGFLLFVYILVIGPLDYYVLGIFRRRRWTWILFPAISIGFAWATISLSNWYMRFQDNRRSVSIVDLGNEGTVARTNRFETLFAAVPSDVVTDVTRSYFTAMNHQKFGQGTWYAYQQATTRGTENLLELVGVPEYTGRLPAKYQVLQALPQWTPQLNRLLQFSGAEKLPAFDWDAPEQMKVFNAEGQIELVAHQQLGRMIADAFGANAFAFIVTGKQVRQIAGSGTILGPQDPQVVSTTAYTSQLNPYYNMQRGTASFLQDICTAEALGGLFGVASQVSPSGGTDFEDLALLDPSDPGQWLLVVAIEQGDDLVVYRRLYTRESR